MYLNYQSVTIKGVNVDIYSLNTVIVGTGCAGFNAADSLFSLGQKDIAIVTEGIKMGTSRNTGSDKQTYYKLTLAGGEKDSIFEMAQTLFNGGCMHGDIALIEAALSARSFFKLVELGVPFPHNEFGEYVGYKTDHDPRQRASSAGPLTSKYMTESLERRVIESGIKIFDGYQVIGILTVEGHEEQQSIKHREQYNNHTNNNSNSDNDNSHVNYSQDNNQGNNQAYNGKAIGLIAINMNKLMQNAENASYIDKLGITLFNCRNVIYATGGPAGIYSMSVYPESQIGSTGIAFEAGVKGINLTESQYGIASIKFRWNLSGTYQQVLPRYVSTDINGEDEKEFLNEYFPDPGKMLDAVFLKGYQWPFDPRKVANYGSSLIDILVYNETQIKGRRVFLDYTRNPGYGSKDNQLDFSLLGPEAYEYLENSEALFGTPIERLAKMNSPAIDLYKSNGIDLEKEYLEIAVCAQHNNGGLAGNIWWESNIKHFFPVGEVNGTFGVYRPGGSALNSTQTGSLRAAQYIATNPDYKDQPLDVDEFIKIAKTQVEKKIKIAESIILNSFNMNNSKAQLDSNLKTKAGLDLKLKSNVWETRKRMQERMTGCGAHIRSYEEVVKAIHETAKELENIVAGSRISCMRELPEVFRNIDIAITQYVYLNAIREYIEKGGKSRGSYLIHDDKGVLPVETLPEVFRFTINDDDRLQKIVNEVRIEGIERTFDIAKKEDKEGIKVISEWIPVHPIPQNKYWFENIWGEFRNKFLLK